MPSTGWYLNNKKKQQVPSRVPDFTAPFAAGGFHSYSKLTGKQRSHVEEVVKGCRISFTHLCCHSHHFPYAPPLLETLQQVILRFKKTPMCVLRLLTRSILNSLCVRNIGRLHHQLKQPWLFVFESQKVTRFLLPRRWVSSFCSSVTWQERIQTCFINTNTVDERYICSWMWSVNLPFLWAASLIWAASNSIWSEETEGWNDANKSRTDILK